MARTGWGRHTVVATGSNDSTKQISVNAWNNDLDTDGLLGFTKQAGTISGGAIVPTGSVIEIQADGTLDELTPTNNNEFDLLYLIAKSTATSVTIDHDASGGAGKIRLLSGGDETLSTTTPMILMCRTISSNKEWVQYGGGIVNALNDIGDVVITSVANEDVLAYDSTTSKWINQSADESGRVTATSTNTFENKTVDLADNTLTGSVAEFNTALQSESFATLGGTETLVSKTLTSPVVNTQITGTAVLDSDTMSGASATTIATSESIKAYVDSQDHNISDGEVTNAKLANMAGNTIKVRNASDAGVPSDIALATTQILIGDGTGFTAAALSGDVTMTNAGAVTVGTLNQNTTGSSASCTGLSATATALATGRAIGGTSFNGTADIDIVEITVADTTDTTCNVALFESATGELGPKSDAGLTYNAGTGTLTATAFAGPITGAVTGNVTGDLTGDVTGDVSGSAATATTAAGLSATLAVASGGTNLTSYAAGDLLYATGATTLAKLAKGTGSQTLKMNSGATAPEWVTVTSGADTPWDVVHNFADYYYDMEVQTKPADPSADHGRFYVKEIDTNNDGVFCIIRKNGGFEETQIV